MLRIATTILILISLAAETRNSFAHQASESETPLVVTSCNLFAIDLYKVLSTEDDNVFISPYSLYAVLAMTGEGARRNTAVEFGNVLRFPETLRSGRFDIPWDMTPIHTSLSSIDKKFAFTNESEITHKINELASAYLDSIIISLNAGSDQDTTKLIEEMLLREKRASKRLSVAKEEVPHYELRSSNSVWIQDSYPINDEYVELIGGYYSNAGVFEVDFVRNSGAAQRRVSDWIELKTKGRMKPTFAFPGATRIVLVNATYFSGEWQEPFDEKHTTRQDFVLATTDTIKTTMMKSKHYGAARYGAFNSDGSYFVTPTEVYPGQKDGLYPDADGYSVLEIPYKNCDLAMVVISPNSPDGLAAIELQLSPSKLESWVNELRSRAVNILMPKLEMEEQYSLRESLNSMGLNLAFDMKNADLSGINAAESHQGLWVSDVLQRTMLKVNEKGTEAAAVSVATLVASSKRADEKIAFTPTFKADRPFVFAIRDTETGLLLFIGKVAHPKEVTEE